MLLLFLLLLLHSAAGHVAVRLAAAPAVVQIRVPHVQVQVWVVPKLHRELRMCLRNLLARARDLEAAAHGHGGKGVHAQRVDRGDVRRNTAKRVPGEVHQLSFVEVLGVDVCFGASLARLSRSRRKPP